LTGSKDRLPIAGERFAAQIARPRTSLATAKATGEAKDVEEQSKALRTNHILQFNCRLDAAVIAVFLALVAAVALLSFREWILLLARRKLAVLRESQPTWLPDYAIAESRLCMWPVCWRSASHLVKELSGQSHLERAQATAMHHENRLRFTATPLTPL